MENLPDESSAYITYNGLNRPAMLWGVPLIIFFCGLVSIVAFGIPGIFYLGLKGVIIPSIIFLFLFAIRVVCEIDPNAITLIAFKIRGFLLKLKHKNGVIRFSSIRS
ncbi:VirB3 family type IV secretion system protein [Pantoea sp. BAV 3049]|uniref:VirB3 family type IV secretion system protein n=1 Tax=Pantoea sp. BAV 3049 TaxID=2654188 RepID=UPI00131E58A8|nr:VirB3 family type IV secretion system protein [Pantoea sp. BAV 3049]